MLGEGSFWRKFRMGVRWTRTVATVGEGSNVSFVRLVPGDPIEDSTWLVEKGDAREEKGSLLEAITTANKLNNDYERSKAGN
jgi:hypothetical protein